MKRFIIFVALSVCFVFSTKLINATGFEDLLPLRSKSATLNEGGFIFSIMKKEIWKEMPGYTNLYLVSSYGNIKSVRRERVKGGIKKTRLQNNGYLITDLW